MCVWLCVNARSVRFVRLNSSFNLDKEWFVWQKSHVYVFFILITCNICCLETYCGYLSSLQIGNIYMYYMFFYIISYKFVFALTFNIIFACICPVIITKCPTLRQS